MFFDQSTYELPEGKVEAAPKVIKVNIVICIGFASTYLYSFSISHSLRPYVQQIGVSAEMEFVLLDVLLNLA